MSSDEESLPETLPGSANGDDVEELPETDPEDGNESSGSVEEAKEEAKVADDDYDSFDDFEAVPTPARKKRTLNDTVTSLSSSEDSEAADDSEYLHVGQETQETQPAPRKYILRDRKQNSAECEEVKKSGTSADVSKDSLDDSLDDPEFVESALDTKMKIKRKHHFLDDGEFFTDKPAVKVSLETRKKWASMTSPPAEALAALMEFFGHKKFREKQWDVVRNVLGGNDQFVLMSTGYGKSVCYQLPSLLLNSLTVVISPLISLMNDQVTTLVAKGIDAIKLDGDSSQKDWDRVVNDIHRIRFIYMSPEMATSTRGLDLLAASSEHVTLLAVDEAHCVSQWGHDFRNSYRHLAAVRNRSELCFIPMIALTATATVRVRDDVIQNLKLRNPRITTTSFDRKNLYISVHSAKEMTADLNEYLETDETKGRHFGGPTIVYCQTKQMVEDVNSALRKLGVRSAHYHAGMTKVQRAKSHTDFMKDKITTIVATVAFGMGIDKPDVRHVIHYGCPKDIESYYQEMGRAGRDGAPSVCRVFWAPKEIVTNKFKARNSQVKEEVIDNLLLMLKQLELVLTTAGCRRYQLLKHFDPDVVKPLAPQTDCCDRCTEMISKNQDISSSLLDVATEAKWLFQVIREMYDGKTGMGKPIEFLRGSSKEEWRMKTLQQKQLFGIGKNLSEKWWKEVTSALRMAGYITEVRLLNVRFGNCVSLSSSAKSWMESGKELLVEATPALLQGKQEKRKPTAAEGAASSGQDDVQRILGATKKRDYKWANEDDELKNLKEDNVASSSEKVVELRKRLDDLRVQMASEHDIAPFQVVSNSVLEALTNLRPNSLEKLNLIEGFSATQKQRYGKLFMDFVIKFAQENGLSTNVNGNETIPPVISETMERELTDSIRRVYRTHLLSRGDAKTIATTCGLAESTVYSYLATAADKGLPLHLDRLNVTRKIVAVALKAAREKLGSNVLRLAPWKDAIGDIIDYNQLRLIKGILIYEYGLETSKEGTKDSPSSSSHSKPTVGARQSSSQEPVKKKFKL